MLCFLPRMAWMDETRLKSSIQLHFLQGIGIWEEGHLCTSIDQYNIWALSGLLSRVCEYAKKNSCGLGIFHFCWLILHWNCQQRVSIPLWLCSSIWILLSASFCTKKNTSSHILRNQNKLACAVLHVATGRLVTGNKLMYLCTVLKSHQRCSHKTRKTQKKSLCCANDQVQNFMIKLRKKLGGLFLKVLCWGKPLFVATEPCQVTHTVYLQAVIKNPVNND